MKWLWVGFFLPALILAQNESFNPFKDAEKWIDIINNDPKSTWKAGKNFDYQLPATYLKSLLGTKIIDSHNFPKRKNVTDHELQNIPESFDSRKHWKNCKSLQEIRDQGNCDSCWAVAAASTFADRLCIASEEKVNIHLSQEELTACCYECGNGCRGGMPIMAWVYFQTHGIVSGGDYNSSSGCQPYSLQPCEHHCVEGPRPKCSSLGDIVTPQCYNSCTNKDYQKTFSQDLWKVSTYYFIEGEEQMQADIIKYGPIEATFTVYDDFLCYKTGVYNHNPASRALGGHAVKLIGWGVEEGVKYWLVQNSWNYDWGDHGLFKILRGVNECNFESSSTAGIPAV